MKRNNKKKTYANSKATYRKIQVLKPSFPVDCASTFTDF